MNAISILRPVPITMQTDMTGSSLIAHPSNGLAITLLFVRYIKHITTK